MTMRTEGFLDQLAGATIQRLLAAGTRQRFPRASYLYLENDVASSVYVVEDGAVRIERHAPDGRSTLLDLMMPGELLGEFSVFESRPRSASAVTVNEAHLLVIPAHRFLELFDTIPDLARGTARWMSLRLRGFADRFLEATHSPATTRVCARLVQLMAFSHQTGGSPVIVVMPISQAELAEWAGLSREAAVKALRELRRDGVVETSRGKVLVLEPDELQRRAEAILQ